MRLAQRWGGGSVCLNDLFFCNVLLSGKHAEVTLNYSRLADGFSLLADLLKSWVSGEQSYFWLNQFFQLMHLIWLLFACPVPKLGRCNCMYFSNFQGFDTCLKRRTLCNGLPWICMNCSGHCSPCPCIQCRSFYPYAMHRKLAELSALRWPRPSDPLQLWTCRPVRIRRAGKSF